MVSSGWGRLKGSLEARSKAKAVQGKGEGD